MLNLPGVPKLMATPPKYGALHILWDRHAMWFAISLLPDSGHDILTPHFADSGINRLDGKSSLLNSN